MSNQTIEEWQRHLYNDEIYDLFAAKQKLSNTTDKRTVTAAESIRFYIDGNYNYPVKGKARGADIPVITREHKVTLNLRKFAFGDYVEDFDQWSTRHELRSVTQQNLAIAFAAQCDRLVVEAIDNASGIDDLGDKDKVLDLNLIQTIVEEAAVRLMPKDPTNSFALLTPAQWEALMLIDEFSHADKAGSVLPWAKNIDSRIFRGITWMRYYLPRNLQNPKVGGMFISDDKQEATGVLWHKNAVGYGELEKLKLDVGKVIEKGAYFVSGQFAANAIVKNTDGVIKFTTKNTRS